MQKRPRFIGKNGGGEKTFTFTTTGIVKIVTGMLAVAALVGGTWRMVGSIATKDDVNSIKALVSPQISDHEMRIRSLELSNAAHFGASPMSARPGSTYPGEFEAGFVLAQMQYPNSVARQSQIPAEQTQFRRVVVPQELIESYKLPPTRGGTYALLGEDGRYYSLDDVLAVIIRMHLDEMRGRSQRSK